MKIVGTVLGCIVVAVLAAIAFICSGLYDIAAVTPDNRIMAWVLHQTFASSVARRVGEVQVPLNLETAEAVRAGAHFYNQNCVICLGTPGQQLTAISHGMYPAPPNILAAQRRNEPAGCSGLSRTA